MEKNIVHAITRDGSARIIYINSTNIVSEAIRLHKLSKTASAALGRALTATSIMGTMLKDEKSTITFQIKGDGPLGTVICVSDSKGNVRGYADNPFAELPPNKIGKLDVGGVIGKGLFYVIKDMGMDTPYIGQCELVTGEIGDDLTEYFAKSEQTPSVCAFGVKMRKDITCEAAGGFIVQLLPFADEAIIPVLEENISKISSVSNLISEGKTADEIIKMAFGELEYDILSEDYCEYKCNCSRERYERALICLGKEELCKLIEEGNDVETECHFCGAKYTFSVSELKKMKEQAKK